MLTQRASKRNKNNKKLLGSGGRTGKIQTVRDVFAIIRDFFVIAFFIVLILALLAAQNDVEGALESYLRLKKMLGVQ